MVIFDNINHDAITIGNSYLRYWLPIYILCIPLTCHGLVALTRIFHKRMQKNIFLALLVIIMGIFSTNLVVFSGSESILAINRSVSEYYDIREKVGKHIEPEAVIVLNRADKIFWPERKVISYMGNDEVFVGVSELLKNNIPVYFYHHTFLPEELFQRLNTTALSEFGVQLRVFKVYGEGDYLYVFEMI